MFSTQLRGAADGQILLWFVGGEATNNRKHTLPEENCSELITWSAICHSYWSLFNAGNNHLETKQARAHATKVNAVFCLKIVNFCWRLAVKISNIYQHEKMAKQNIPHISKNAGQTVRL